MDKVCQAEVTPKAQPQVHTLLQQQDEKYTSGFACTEIQSVFFLMCGVWAHTKLIKVPEIERVKPVSTQTCRQWVSSAKYQGPSGTVSLAIPGETIISGDDVGIVSIDHQKAVCQGQQIKMKGNILSDVVEMSQTRIQVKKIDIKGINNLVEVEQDHLILPSNCLFERNFCKTSTTTYIWDTPKNVCPLKINKKLELHPIKGTDYLVDPKEQVVLKKKNLVSGIQDCPIIELFQTEYPNLFLTTSDTTGLEEVREVNLITLMNTKLTFSFYLAEQEAQRSLDIANQDLCKLKLNLDQKQEISLGNGSFISRKGDLLLVATCLVKSAPIKEGVCTTDIPIENGKFVDVTTRQLKDTSPPRPCGTQLVIKSNEAWIRIGSKLERFPTPEEFPTSHSNLHMYDFSTKGIYTKHEITQWRHDKETEGFHQMIQRRITLGVCAGEKLCKEEPGMPVYDMGKLMPSLDLDPFSQIREYVKEWGFWVSFAVLIIEGLRLATFLVMMSITFLQEGMNGVLVLILGTCGSINSYRRLRRNRQKYESVLLHNKTQGACVVENPSAAPLMTD